MYARVTQTNILGTQKSPAIIPSRFDNFDQITFKFFSIKVFYIGLLYREYFIYSLTKEETTIRLRNYDRNFFYTRKIVECKKFCYIENYSAIQLNVLVKKDVIFKILQDIYLNNYIKDYIDLFNEVCSIEDKQKFINVNLSLAVFGCTNISFMTVNSCSSIVKDFFYALKTVYLLTLLFSFLHNNNVNNLIVMYIYLGGNILFAKDCIALVDEDLFFCDLRLIFQGKNDIRCFESLKLLLDFCFLRIIDIVAISIR
jgi:hypothetical protein